MVVVADAWWWRACVHAGDGDGDGSVCWCTAGCWDGAARTRGTARSLGCYSTALCQWHSAEDKFIQVLNHARVGKAGVHSTAEADCQ